MKKQKLPRRLISLTLAASVALPQSTVFAASLWTEQAEERLNKIIQSASAEEQTRDELTELVGDVDRQQPVVDAISAAQPRTGALDVDTDPPQNGPEYSDISEEKKNPSLPTEEKTDTPATDVIPDDDSQEKISTLPVVTTSDDNDDQTEQVVDEETDDTDQTEVRTPLERTELDAPETVLPQEIPAVADDVDNAENTDLSLDVDSFSAALTALNTRETFWPMSLYRIGYGVQFSGGAKGSSAKLTQLGGLFAVETTEGTLYGAPYGYRNYNDPEEPSVPFIVGSDKLYHSFVVFPSAAMLGRVPDQQFEGWYVYASGDKAGDQDPTKWVYGDEDKGHAAGYTMSKVTTEDYGADSPGYGENYTSINGYSTFGALGDSWDGGADYGYGHYFQYDGDGNIIWAEDEYGDVVPQYGDADTNPVSIVGRWVPSKISSAKDGQTSLTGYLPVFDEKTQETRLEATALTLYASDISTKPLSECAEEETEFTADRLEYWLRVPANMDTLDIAFHTSELYYADYVRDTGKAANDPDAYSVSAAKSHVQVNTIFDNVTTSYVTAERVASGDTKARMAPMWDTKFGEIEPTNTINDPAHSEWVVKGISLSPAAGAGKLYTDIQVIIRSPSGDKTTTYTFHVQRLTEPALTQSWGNTPIGMIERDVSEKWGTTQSEIALKKKDAKDAVIEDRKFDDVLYPNGSANQTGTVYRKAYSVEAWLTEDVDLDPTAIVVYQDSSFLDPGIRLTDSEGLPVDITAGKVERTLRLQSAVTLSADSIGKSGTDSWYAAGALVEEETYEILSAADGSDQIDLRGMNILPGIYALEYRFKDQVAGNGEDRIYGVDSGDYVTEIGKENAASFRRTVVILPTPGDVDMDGAVTMADALALERLLDKNALSGQITLNKVSIAADQMAALFAYRVCDINGDGVLDHQDVEALKKLPNPKTRSEENASNSDYFYIPLPTGEETEHYTRPILTVDETAVAKLKLEYLGKESGAFQAGGYISNDSTNTGPWSKESDLSGVELQDVFWLGVSIENAAELTLPSVKSFTFTIVYDSTYLEPAVVLNQSDWEMLGAGYDEATEEGRKQQAVARWTGMMRRYNLAGTAQTVWSAGSYSFAAATGYGSSFTSHYSTAITPLETSIGASQLRSRLKELTFSIETSGDGVKLQSAGEKGWILAVPFKLIQHPFNQKSAQLVEFKAGMQSFTLVGSDHMAAAYSSQSSIFGGNTVDLKERLGYGNVGVDIPLGEDKTEIYWVANGSSETAPNARYDVYFESRGGWTKPEEGKGVFQSFPVGGELIGELPPGLTYHRNNAYISGTPSQAGTYDFSIGSVPYRIVVEKATLHFWAENQRSYYGQPQFRTETSNDFTYRYDIDDIRSFERDRAAASGGEIKVDGVGSNLEKLLNDLIFSDPVNQPYFKAGVDETTAVTVATDVGTYPIWCRTDPQSTNYEFVYTPERAGGNTGLTILQRPIQVVGINGTLAEPTVVGSVFSDRPGQLGNLRAQLNGNDSTAHTFEVRLGVTVTDVEGEYDKLPLTTSIDYIDGVVLPEDSLIVTYTAQYIRTAADQAEGSGGFFVLEEGENEGLRDVVVNAFSLIGGVGYENYRLVNTEAVQSVREGRVQGKVLRRNIKSIEITQLPPMEYRYGDQLVSASALHYYIVKDGNQEQGQYAYSAESVQSLGITVTWVTEEERAAYLNGEAYTKNDALPYLQNQRFTTEYNGRYISLTVSTADDNGDPVIIRRFSDVPLTVNKRVLTLTAVPASRFYGEENVGLSFTYDPMQLANVDRRSGLTGDGEELRELLSDENSEEHGWTQNYVEPTLRAVFLAKDPAELTTSDDLKKSSPYTGMNNAVMIYGAQSDNYAFQYVFTNTEGASVIQNGYGASTYRIEKRLIVVEEVKKADEPLVQLYADTRRIYTEGLPLSMDEVVLGLPEHTDTETTYFSTGGSAGQAQMGYAAGATAIVGDDTISFTYRATVIPTDGTDYIKYTDFSKGYFNMDTDDAGGNLSKGYKEYPVQVSNLTLTGASANNYVLVYKSEHCGVNGLPNTYQQISGGVDPEVNATKTYYAAKVNGETAMAKVWLRPIKDIEILSTGKMRYTYGEFYTPNQWDQDSRDRRGMVVRIHYENDPAINNFDGNSTEEDVSYLIHHYLSDGTAVTTYGNRGLGIYYLNDDIYENYLKTGVVALPAAHMDNEMRLQTPLYVQHEHNGAHLVVLGERASQTAPVISLPTEEALEVSPKTLTIRADDKRRSYGEENEAFTFSFDASQLAIGDREALGVSYGMQDGALLEKLAVIRFYNYTSPTFVTTADKKSDVLNGGQSGYPIVAATAGALDNYTLTYEEGTLYIYPRVVKIAGFDQTAAIHTIFSNDSARTVYTEVTSDRFTLAHSTVGGYTLNGGTTILYTTGDALVEGDTIRLTIQVKYPDSLNLNEDSKKDVVVQVENATIRADGTNASGNYQLEQGSNKQAVIMDGKALGRVELRNITEISLQHEPNKLTYTYGEPLDLTGLSIHIDYNAAGAAAGTGNQINVEYQGPGDFAQYGLRVYYYNYPTLRDDLKNIESLGLRQAATGDHLTIAPTHDTQTRGSNALWAANGKYLLIVAQRHKDQNAVAIIVDTPIKVNPRPIQFTLSAEDKIYDGTTQAAGTITFTNIYNQSGIVDDYNTNGVTDLVYPVIGASYEKAWDTLYGASRGGAFEDFKEYVKNKGGYVFTTGKFVDNDPAKPTENAELAWTQGYTYGSANTLTFTYLDPNVAYMDEPEHDYYSTRLDEKEVQVTGLRLAGPDAANYTLVGRQFTEDTSPSVSVQVTAGNLAEAREEVIGSAGTEVRGYQGTGLPTATIHKANREDLTTELLPQVEIDPHTNVVRIVYDQDLSAIGGEAAAYQKELHFEFALQQISLEETGGPEDGEGADPEAAGTLTVTDIQQLAGADGSATWADLRYFGGEAAPMTALEVVSSDPEGTGTDYVPKEEDIPKADSITDTTVIKGQVYQWSADDNGFVLDPNAYPGGTIWPGYDLYTTDRTALARDTVFLPVVRAAETHNYNASLALSAVEGYTPEMVQALLDARKARDTAGDPSSREQAQQALDKAIQAAGEAILDTVLDAKAAAQAEVDALMAAGESGSKLEERPVQSAAPAVKTYKQTIETVSLKELQGEGMPSGSEPYLVPTLEDIWFTDVQEIPSKEVLDAVVWNTDPVRYRIYAWDNELNVPLEFEKETVISLDTSFEVEIPGESGGEGSGMTVRVNEDHNLRLYADITFPTTGQSKKVEQIILRPGTVMAALGDEPVELEVTFYPEQTRRPTVLWVSSDPDVAVVDSRGVISFVGVGTAYIIATVPANLPNAQPLCSAYIQVTVVENWKSEYPDSIFDFGYLNAFLLPSEADDDGGKLFLPEAGLTRGETAILLSQFYMENPTWSKSGPQEFTDLTGEEEYAEAAQLLGSLGVFVGYEDGSFGGEQYISRAEFITLLVRMTGLKTPDTAGQTHAFLDTGEEDTWAYSEIDAMSTQPGVLMGVGEGYFAPKRNIIRSEAAAFLTRLLRFPLNQAGELIVPLDVTEDYWARESILRAINGSQILEESLLTEEG